LWSEAVEEDYVVLGVQLSVHLLEPALEDLHVGEALFMENLASKLAVRAFHFDGVDLGLWTGLGQAASRVPKRSANL